MITPQNKFYVEVGDYLTLTDGIYCRVNKTWHGKDNAWLEVAYNNGKAYVLRSVELGEIAGMAPEPLTDPK